MSGPHSEHHELQLLLGGYVLGGLCTADRHRLEDHLPNCPECSAELAQFAVVPGLLRLTAVSGLQPEQPAPPAESLPRLLAAAKAKRRRRRRRGLLFAAAATVIVLAGVAFGVWSLNRPAPPPPSTALVTVEAPELALSGQVTLEPKAWGTQIRLTMYYGNGRSGPLSVVAVAADGHEEQAGSWTLPPVGRCYVVGATSVQRDQLARLDIRTADGRTVLRAAG
jgi:putative zinc finger protein